MLSILLIFKNSTLLIQRFEPKCIFLVDLGLLHINKLALPIQLPKPLRLLWENHRVIVEHDHRHWIQLLESPFVLVVGGVFFFIIKIRQENSLVHIILVLLKISHVVCGAEGLLYQFMVRVQHRERFYTFVDLAPHLILITRTIRTNLHSIIRPADSN
jgi:hypothetical protein